MKKNHVKIQENDSEEDVSVQGNEDVDADGSMIENGSNESDSDEENEDSDDGFSENDSENVSQIKENIKRQREPITQNYQAKKPKIEAHLYKPPTVEEINQLRETENLFHSNLFRLQVQEMLKEIKIKEKYKTFIVTWIDELNAFIEQLTSMSEPENLDKIKWLAKSEIQIPFNSDGLKTKPFQFQFMKPNEKAIPIGSALNQTIIGPNLIVDVCIFMPAKSFQKDDYLNLVYDKKRALYLACLASKMIKSKFNCSEMRFNYFRNNPYKPVLEVTPSGKECKKLLFRLFVAPEQGSFKMNRFVPWNSNIRASLFDDSLNNQEEEILYATPCYNANVLFDLTIKNNQNVIEEITGRNKNLQEGLILLKIWLRQRSLDKGYSGFGSHIIAMFLVYLFKEKKLHASMSSYQIARNVWNHLAISNWHKDGQGITLCKEYSAPNQPTLEQFHASYDVVFVDSTGFLNMCANVSLDVYMKVKSESQKAVDLLNNKAINSFQALFFTKMPVYTQFDHILKLCKKNCIEQVLQNYGVTSDRHNFAGFWFPQILKMISNVLRKGLDERILSLTPIETTTEPWDVKTQAPEMAKSIILGFVLNPEKAYEILDKGPQANEDTSQAYRDFWGDKSELRRFQDGSITETCVWGSASEPFSKRRLIVKRIILHLLRKHFTIGISKLVYLANQFDLCFKLNRMFYLLENVYNDAESTTLDVTKAFNGLGKYLRSLDNLPLDINSIQGTSSVFRYCDPIPILGQGKSYKEQNKIIFQAYKVYEGVIQLGLSGKWPDDLAAFRRIKTAFHIQIARALRSQFNIETVAGSHGVSVLKDGYVFKVEICHQKEIALMKKKVSSKGVTQYNDTPESLELEKRLVVLPKVTSVLHGLYQRYPSFGPTVMIAKRWLYSQMLDPHLWPDECTELLIASQYMKTAALQIPCQPQTGFFRFLHLLANTDWASEMFLLNFNEEMSQEEITEVGNQFSAERDIFPPLFIATSYDTRKDSIWSKNAPNVQVLIRVTLLARHTLQFLEPIFTTAQDIDVRDLFLPSLDGYDAIINLRSNLVHTCLAYDFESVNKAKVAVDATIPAAGFDPVQRGLHELREAYSDFAVFFYNPCGGKEIAVIWKPEVFEEKEFKVTSVNGCKVIEKGQMKCDLTRLMEDFKVVLKGLYYSIEDKSGKCEGSNYQEKTMKT